MECPLFALRWLCENDVACLADYLIITWRTLRLVLLSLICASCECGGVGLAFCSAQVCSGCGRSENLYREECETLAGAETIRRKNIILKNWSNTLYASHCRGQMVPETFGGQVVAKTCEDMVLDDSRKANASFGRFLVNTVERNDRSHSMRAQQIHHSNNEGDCDSNCASDADVDFHRDDNGRQHDLKPFVFSGQLSFSNFDGRRIASPTTADCIRDWTVISDGGKPHTIIQDDDGDCDSNNASDADVDFDNDDTGRSIASSLLFSAAS